MIQKIKVWLWSWFAPDKYVAHIVREAMEDVTRVQGGASE